MSAVVVATDFGGPEVVAVIDEPTPEPGPGQVRVAVRAVGVNPIDFKSYSGMFGTDRSILPKRLGSEASGVVDAVGADVAGIEVGDEMIAYLAPGAYAEHLVLGPQALTRKPDGMPWTEAAGLMLTGAAAWHAILAADVGPGDTVLIHGATGGVGLMAVQLAVGRHARVIGTAAPDAHDLIRDLGATPVAYGDGLAGRVRAAAPGGVDAAIDAIGTDEAIDVSLEFIANPRRIVSLVAFGRGGDGITLLGSGPGADPGTEIREAARAKLADAAAAGTIKVHVAKTFPLAQAADAHRELMTGRSFGKYVLTV